MHEISSFSILRGPVSEPHSGAALSIDGAQVNVKQHGSNAHHENTGNDGEHFRSSSHKNLGSSAGEPLPLLTRGTLQRPRRPATPEQS
jgi:hypothetical protein